MCACQSATLPEEKMWADVQLRLPKLAQASYRRSVARVKWVWRVVLATMVWCRATCAGGCLFDRRGCWFLFPGNSQFVTNFESFQEACKERYEWIPSVGCIFKPVISLKDAAYCQRDGCRLKAKYVFFCPLKIWFFRDIMNLYTRCKKENIPTQPPFIFFWTTIPDFVLFADDLENAPSTDRKEGMNEITVE